MKQRRLHKAFLRYHDPENWPLLRDALKRMGRADLIGNGKHHLVPRWQPAGTGRGSLRKPKTRFPVCFVFNRLRDRKWRDFPVPHGHLEFFEAPFSR